MKHIFDKNLCKIPINSIPFVSEVGTGTIIKPYAHVNRKADFNVMIYITHGEMEVIEEGVSYCLSPGTLFFLKEGVQHWGEKDFKVGTSWYYAHFYTAPVLEGMTPFHERNNEKLIIEEGPDKIKDYIQIPKMLHVAAGDSLENKIIALSKLQKTAQWVRRNLLMFEILLECYERMFENQIATKEEILVKSIINYLEKNYRQKFSMEDVEGHIGLTYKYIGSIFKKNTGITIKSYQIMLRLREAGILLGESPLTIGEIADITGFGDVYYFSKVFKREKGTTPGQFRKEYQPKI